MPNDKTGEIRDIEVILEILNEDNRTNFCIVLSPSFLRQKKKKNDQRAKDGRQWLEFLILETEGPPSLLNFGRSDRRNSSGQEAKLLYAERPTRGLQF